ncbi:MAG: hypothetical protein HZA77_02355 [Candidatus Schekmanbacteria bacterium]|nr:hypothetical protein [Candidatus Schekmanbacteria bacterium]
METANQAVREHYNNIAKKIYMFLGAYWVLLLAFLFSDFIFHHIGYTITADESPINWFTAVDLVLASFAAVMVFSELSGFSLNRGKYKFLWIVIASGLLWAAFDEQFELHEKVGAIIDSWVSGSSLELFFYRIFDEGEKLIIMLYAAGGIMMTFVFLFNMVSSKKAAKCFITAIIFQVLAMLCDRFNVVFDILGIYSKDPNYTGYIEEISEFLSSSLFFGAMLLEYFWLRVLSKNKI